MWIGTVIGTVWSTVRHAPLLSARLVLVERLDGNGEWEAAVDTVGSGPGDRVMVISSYEATLPLRDQNPALDVVGVDAAVVGILDPKEVSTS
mgnify:CR=1 FL=1|jgi:microcompartment protein CcmK/EutM